MSELISQRAGFEICICADLSDRSSSHIVRNHNFFLNICDGLFTFLANLQQQKMGLHNFILLIQYPYSYHHFQEKKSWKGQ